MSLFDDDGLHDDNNDGFGYGDSGCKNNGAGDGADVNEEADDAVCDGDTDCDTDGQPRAWNNICNLKSIIGLVFTDILV